MRCDGVADQLSDAAKGDPHAADPASTSTPDPVTQDTTDNSSFFSAQNPAPGLTQTATVPMTRTRGS